MRYLFFILLFSISVSSFSQDSTGASITDSTRMYRYVGTYVVISYFDVLPPGLRNTDATRWTIQAYMKVYATKADYSAGKPELFGRYLPTWFTALFPTKNDILAIMRQYIK